jgi:MFS family permease
MTKLGSDDEANTDRTASALLCETFLLLLFAAAAAAAADLLLLLLLMAIVGLAAGGTVELSGAAAARAATELFCRLLSLLFSSGGVVVVVGATAGLPLWPGDDVLPAGFFVLPLLSNFLIGGTVSLAVVLWLLTTADYSLRLLAAAGFLSNNASGRTSAEGLKEWIGESSISSSSSKDSPTLVMPVPFKAWTFETKLLFGLVKGCGLKVVNDGTNAN